MKDFDTGLCLRIPRQAQFHPLKFLKALAAAFEKQGGRIFTSTHAKDFEDGKLAQVKTTRGFIIEAGSIVVATNTPVNDWVAIHTKQAAYRTYAIAIGVPKGSAPRALY